MLAYTARCVWHKSYPARQACLVHCDRVQSYCLSSWLQVLFLSHHCVEAKEVHYYTLTYAVLLRTQHNLLNLGAGPVIPLL